MAWNLTNKNQPPVQESRLLSTVPDVKCLVKFIWLYFDACSNFLSLLNTYACILRHAAHMHTHTCMQVVTHNTHLLVMYNLRGTSINLEIFLFDGIRCQGGVAGSNMPTLADLLAVNVFELDDWNYEGEDDEQHTAAVVNITEVSIPVGAKCQIHVVKCLSNFWGQPFLV